MITEITSGVTVATAEMYTTLTTAVSGPHDELLLIDPAVTTADLAALAERFRPTAGFATHAHWDHLLWSRSLGPSVPRYASARTVASATDPANLRRVDEEAPGHDHSLFARLVPAGGDIVPWDGPLAQVITHDAHEAGHSALFFPSPGVLVAGDMLSDIEIPLLDPAGADPAGDYRRGLSRLAALEGVRWVIPGHGHPGDAAEFRRRIDLDRRYLDSPAWGDPRLDGAPDWIRHTHQDQLRFLLLSRRGAGGEGQRCSIAARLGVTMSHRCPWALGPLGLRVHLGRLRLVGE